MASGQPSIGAPAALLVALGIGLLLAWSQRSDGPSRAELARALSLEARANVAAADIRSVSCEQQTDRYACRWRQRIDGDWQDRSGSVWSGPEGWHMIEAKQR